MHIGNSSLLTIAIKQATGKSIKEFSENVLNLNYQTYCYRLKTGGLRQADYQKILKVTGMTWEELFGEQAANLPMDRPMFRQVNQSPVHEVEPVREEEPKKKEEDLGLAPFVADDIDIS